VSFAIDLNTVLLGFIGVLLGVIAWFLRGSYNTLVDNQRELFERQNKTDKRVTALETACSIRHGDSRK
jgi:hypothetical protein